MERFSETTTAPIHERAAARIGVPAALGFLSLLIVAAAIYWPALHGTWLWDDGYEVASNPLLPARDGLAKIWSGQGALDYFPLKGTVQWLLWQIWGPDSIAWHAASITLHALNAGLLWRLFQRLGLRQAWLGALVFTVHPLAVESVAWVAEQKTPLSLVFALLSFLAYLDYDEGGRRSALVRSAALFFAAMLCKSTVVMLPGVLVLFLGWKHGAPSRAQRWSLVPFFATALVLGLVTIWFQHERAIGANAVTAGNLTTRLVRSGAAIFFYVWQSLWPLQLMPVYPRWPVSPPAWYLLPAWPALVLGFAGLWWKRHGFLRHVLFGAGAFVLTLLPITGLIAMAYMHVGWVADHFVYPALPAFAALFAGGVAAILARLTGPVRGIAVASLGMLLVLFALLSWSYTWIFRSPENLWSYAVAHNPDSAVVHNNLGIACVRAGALAQARAHFEAALRLEPGFVAAGKNLRTLDQAMVPPLP